MVCLRWTPMELHYQHQLLTMHRPTSGFGAVLTVSREGEGSRPSSTSDFRVSFGIRRLAIFGDKTSRGWHMITTTPWYGGSIDNLYIDMTYLYLGSWKSTISRCCCESGLIRQALIPLIVSPTPPYCGANEWCNVKWTDNRLSNSDPAQQWRIYFSTISHRRNNYKPTQNNDQQSNQHMNTGFTWFGQSTYVYGVRGKIFNNRSKCSFIQV